MKSMLALGLLTLSLAGCDPGPDQKSATPAPRVAGVATDPDAAGCNAHAEAPWIEQETPPRRYSAEATSLGKTCDNAVALVVIRAREGSPIYTWSGRARDIFGLKDASDAAGMKAGLADWIDQTNSTIRTTADLPSWEKTDGQAEREEFPFHPAAGLDKAGWDDLRKAKLDVFCFPQGAESLACAALRDGEMDDIGLQQFPG